MEAGNEKTLYYVREYPKGESRECIYAFLYTYTKTYLTDSIPVRGPGLVAEIIALEDTTRKQARSSLDAIGSDKFLRECNFPGIMAGIKF